MKFLSWVFSATLRHSWDIRRYEKGLGGRIATFFIILFVVGGTCGLEYWFYNSLTTGADFAIIFVSALLALAFVLTAIDFSATFSYVAFRNAFFGIVMTTAKMIDKKKRKKKYKDVPAEEIEKEVEEEYSSIKTYKALDIVFAIVFLALTVALIASIVLVPVKALALLSGN